LYEALCDTKFQDDGQIKFYKKKYDNTLTHLKELSKRMYYKQRLLEEGKNISKTRAIVNEVLNNNQRKNCQIPYVIGDKNMRYTLQRK